MASLSLQNFSSFVSNAAAATQAACSSLIDFTIGSPLRAILEANASIALWLQWLVVLVLARTRLATSNGGDVDSWVGDFGLTRLTAVYAPGNVTFSRYSATSSALIVPGAQVKTADGTQSFVVTTNTASPAWSAALGGYVAAAGVSSVTVPVAAVNAGTQGNVQAGAISLISSAIPHIDTVTNAAAFTGGIDAETDAALRARFILFINSRSLATVAAIGAAIASVQQGLTYSVIENATSGGAFSPGNILVYVDDGSGSPSTALKAAVLSAVNAVRPIGSTISVFGPTVVSASIAATITTASGYVDTNVTAAADLALTAYVNALPMGAPLPYSRIAQIIYDTSAGITNVTGVALNGGTSDLGGATGQVVRASTVVVS